MIALTAEESLRRSIAAYAIEQADGPQRSAISRLYEVWHEINRQHFALALTPPLILLTPPHSARALADYSPWSGFGGRTQIRLRPSVVDGTYKRYRPDHDPEDRWRYVSDILLHETIHQYQHEVIGHADGYGGHNRDFSREANRIGLSLGLAAVVIRTRPHDPSAPICATFPHCVREEGYYGDLLADPEEADPSPQEEEEGQEDGVTAVLRHLHLAACAYTRLDEAEQVAVRTTLRHEPPPWTPPKKLIPRKPSVLEVNLRRMVEAGSAWDEIADEMNGQHLRAPDGRRSGILWSPTALARYFHSLPQETCHAP